MLCHRILCFVIRCVFSRTGASAKFERSFIFVFCKAEKFLSYVIYFTPRKICIHSYNSSNFKIKISIIFIFLLYEICFNINGTLFLNQALNKLHDQDSGDTP